MAEMKRMAPANGCPCRECQERHVGCHSACEKYAGWRERLNEVNHARWQEAQRTKISDTKRKWLIREMKKRK